MKPGRKGAAKEQEATIRAQHSAIVAAAAVGAGESAIAAMAGGAPIGVPESSGGSSPLISYLCRA